MRQCRNRPPIGGLFCCFGGNMGWRIVYVTSGEKLSVSLNNLILTRGQEKLSIPLEDIDTLIVDNIQAIVTISAFCALCDHKINLLLCDAKHNPKLTLLPISGYFRQGKSVEEQLLWSEERKSKLWQQIVEFKIKNQSSVCNFKGESQAYAKLKELSVSVLPGDLNNREAVAARIYFKSVFGETFSRGGDDIINSALNYGYTLILSCFNRALSGKGVLPYLGIHHTGEYNAFNLSCDFMEPFRPFVDAWVLKNIVPFIDCDPSFKGGLLTLLTSEILILGRKEKMHNAIDLFCDSCIKFLSGTVSSLTPRHFPDFTDEWWSDCGIE